MNKFDPNAAPLTKAPTQGAAVLDALGTLPEWDLSDLYDSIDSDVVLHDLEAVTAGSESFAKSYRGALVDLAKNDPDGLLTAVRSFEELQDKLGRIGSFAGLSYASNTTDPKIAKFYGCLLYTSPSPRDQRGSRMPSSA